MDGLVLYVRILASSGRLGTKRQPPSLFVARLEHSWEAPAPSRRSPGKDSADEAAVGPCGFGSTSCGSLEGRRPH